MRGHKIRIIVTPHYLQGGKYFFYFYMFLCSLETDPTKGHLFMMLGHSNIPRKKLKPVVSLLGALSSISKALLGFREGAIFRSQFGRSIDKVLVKQLRQRVVPLF